MTYVANQVHPNPFDGLVHALKEVSVEKGARTIVVKCGATMPTYRGHETLGGATGFNHLVTCPACHQACPNPTCPCQTKEPHEPVL